MKWLIPPLLTALFAALMISLNVLQPLREVVPAPWHWTGALAILAGIATASAGRRLFARARANIWTFKKPTHLVTDGVYRITRNPMYLGFALMLLGLAVLLGSLSPMLIWPFFVVICDRWYIRFEEARMTETFGSDYSAYQSRVRRWI